MLIFQKIYLSLFNKSLISNETDHHKTLEPCVGSDNFGNSGDDQPKEPLVETFENVSAINVKNRLTSHAKFCCDIRASPWVMRVIKQGYSLPFTVEPPPAFFTNNCLLLGIKLLFVMKSRDCWRLVVFVKLNVMKHIDLVR